MCISMQTWEHSDTKNASVPLIRPGKHHSVTQSLSSPCSTMVAVGGSFTLDSSTSKPAMTYTPAGNNTHYLQV